MKEYHEKVEYLHLNPLRAGLVAHPLGLAMVEL